MEKRYCHRCETDTCISCRYFTTKSVTAAFDGKMLNYGSRGMYAELKTHFKEGTLLQVRTTGRPAECFRSETEDGYRSNSLAEVRWSKPITCEGDTCYGIGLKYV